MILRPRTPAARTLSERPLIVTLSLGFALAMLLVVSVWAASHPEPLSTGPFAPESFSEEHVAHGSAAAEDAAAVDAVGAVAEGTIALAAACFIGLVCCLIVLMVVRGAGLARGPSAGWILLARGMLPSRRADAAVPATVNTGAAAILRV